MRELRQRVRLVHELAELVRPEERVDHARDGPRIHQILRGKVLSITQVHPLFDGPRHAGETQRELCGKLLADRTYTAVAKVVNVIHLALAVLNGHELADDRHDIIARKRQHVSRDFNAEPLIQSISADIAKVVADRKSTRLNSSHVAI